MAVTIRQLDQLAGANRVLLRQLNSDVRSLASVIDLSNPVAARDGLLEVVPDLAQVYSEQAAVASAEWYEKVRRTQVGGEYYARIGEIPARAWVEDDVRWAAEHLFSGYDGQTFIELGEAINRKVLHASRDTINRNTTMYDREAAGWQRIARPAGCDFCVMLAQRGAVYRRSTADFAAHNNCNCKARPTWDKSLPEVDVKAYEASKRTAGLSPEQKAQYKTRIDQWLSQNQSALDEYRQAMADIT
jgi:hypothetical protein